MNGKRAFKTFLIVALVATLFLVSFYAVITLWPKGDPIPAEDITAPAADGSLYSLSAHLQKEPVVLVFFELEHRHSQEVIQRMIPAAKKQGIEVVAVCVSALSPEQALARMKELKMPTPAHLLFDQDGSVAKVYNVTSPPCIYFIDKNGMIVDAYLGTISEDSLAKELQELS